VSNATVDRLPRPVFAAAALITYASPVLKSEWAPDCCIAATRLALQVLRPLGFDAVALPVKALILSKELTVRCKSYAKETGKWPGPELQNQWLDLGGQYHSIFLGATDDEMRARGKEPKPDRFAGHLVALVDNQVIVDLSLDQADRPNRGIILKPWAVPTQGRDLVNPPFPTANVNGCLVQYVRSDADGWQAAPDWQKHRTREHAHTVRRWVERALQKGGY